MFDITRFVNLKNLVTGLLILVFGGLFGYLLSERADVLAATEWSQKHQTEYEQDVKPRLERIEKKVDRLETAYLNPIGTVVVENTSGNDVWIRINVSGLAAQLYVVGEETVDNNGTFKVSAINYSANWKPELENIPVLGTYDNPNTKSMARVSKHAAELLGIDNNEATIMLKLEVK